MFYRILFLVLFLLSLTWTVSVTAQDAPPTLPEPSPEPSPSTAILPMLPRMNPAVLLRMRQQLTFELQQTQRTLGFIDPNDKQLTASLQEQQAELTNQLKEINAQLKSQGIPIENQEPPANNLAPKATDIVTETATPLPVNPDLLIQRRENSGTKPITPNTGTELTTPQDPSKPVTSPIPPFQPPFPPIPGIGTNPMNNPESANPLPTPFDQDQAWADSPWVPKPSKELSELKQTVDSLRKEITDLKENIKALETQIQLLNRNILLSQPK
ncbi:MAG: hypothetical protein LBC02_10125 [Planctomycetaceae bacterium]|nr:hypothetical protein [Planctomycetaceae bacterium]